MATRLMLFFLVIACSWLAGCGSNPTRRAAPSGELEGAGALTLEGKTFTGVFYWDRGLAKLVRYKMTIGFENGKLSYRFANKLLNSDPDYKPVPYTTTTDENGNLAFRAHSGGQKENYADMSGVYDGKRLSNVKIVWNEDGESRTFRFKEMR